MAYCTEYFKSRYLASLGYYKSFYDDLYEYGNPDNTDHVFYFIPGFNGVPGQIRFALPSFSEHYDHNIYIQCLYLDEFSARKPIWEKYTQASLEKKHQTMINQITRLSESFDLITIIVNSSGFYDFVAVYPDLSVAVRKKMQLAWIACAPDVTEHSVWEPVFFKLNGFKHNGFRWFSYPNHNWLKPINSECTTDKKWRYAIQKKTFFKNDLESRFYCCRLLWDISSIEAYNWIMEYNLSRPIEVIDIPSVVLVASDDGYWHGKPRSEINQVIHKYLSQPDVLFRDTTHLWVTVPENLSAVLAKLKQLVPQDSSCTPRTKQNPGPSNVLSRLDRLVEDGPS